MSVQMLVLYRAPDDQAAFEQRYKEGHLPLVRQIPGLFDPQMYKVTPGPDGNWDYAYVFSGTVESLDAVGKMMASEEAARVIEDANSFAEGLYEVVLLEPLE
jgi:uncharacterized protein (TIGR02118 family)